MKDDPLLAIKNRLDAALRKLGLALKSAQKGSAAAEDGALQSQIDLGSYPDKNPQGPDSTSSNPTKKDREETPRKGPDDA